jgi:hypothetical protein
MRALFGGHWSITVGIPEFALAKAIMALTHRVASVTDAIIASRINRIILVTPASARSQIATARLFFAVAFALVLHFYKLQNVLYFLVVPVFHQKHQHSGQESLLQLTLTSSLTAHEAS